MAIESDLGPVGHGGCQLQTSRTDGPRRGPPAVRVVRPGALDLLDDTLDRTSGSGRWWFPTSER
jgi:hypothetical protein